MYTNEIIKNIEISLIRQIALKMKKYEDGIDLTIGEPVQDLPYGVKVEMSNKRKIRLHTNRWDARTKKRNCKLL